MFIFVWMFLMVALMFNFTRKLNTVRRYTKKVFIPMKEWENQIAMEDAEKAASGDGTYAGTTTARKYVYSDDQMKILKRFSYNDHSLTLIQWAKKAVKTALKAGIAVLAIFVASAILLYIYEAVMWKLNF